MSKLRISIIIPAYNEERYIGPCLDSIAAQTVAPWEVIVVDNNSTDATAAIAKRYPFVTLVQEPRQGKVHARDAGFAAARGTILARIDADVVIPRGWVAYVAEFYRQPANAEVGLSGGGKPNNLRAARLMCWLQSQIAFRINRLLLGHYIFFGSNMALPRSLWLRVRHNLCQRTDIHEDLDLAIHAHRAGYAIAYHEQFRVVGRAARVISARNELLGNLMLWPRTLRVHGLRAWPFGWLGAVMLYALSPIPLAMEKISRWSGKPPLDS